MKNILLFILLLATAAALTAQQSTEEELASLREEIANLQDYIEQIAEIMEDIDVGASSTTLGGYGELHYNQFDDADNKIDFHRFVIFVNHAYSDNLKLYTELELEHSLAGEGAPGEVELEQAYVNWKLSDQLSMDLGLYLMKVGHLNLFHEPDAFMGVERPSINKYIIPTTWWESGVRINYQLTGSNQISASLNSGLNTQDGYIRAGRQKTASALANNLATNIQWTYSNGQSLQANIGLYSQSDLNQQKDASIAGNLLTARVHWSKGQFSASALYGVWNLSGDVSEEAKNQDGILVQVSYKPNDSLAFFLRQESLTYFKSVQVDDDITTVGGSYYLHPRVVLKFDSITQRSGSNSINLGFGYSF